MAVVYSWGWGVEGTAGRRGMHGAPGVLHALVRLLYLSALGKAWTLAGRGCSGISMEPTVTDWADKRTLFSIGD